MREFAKLFTCVLLSCVGTTSRAAAAELTYPLGIVVDDQSRIYLADRNLPGVWQVSEGKLSLLFEGSKKYRTPLNAVRCLAIDKSGKLLAGDSATREVYRFDEPGKPIALTKGGIGIAASISLNSKGEIIVADLEIGRVVKLPAAGGTPETIAEIAGPRGVFVDHTDRIWVISNERRGRLYRISASGQLEKLIDDCGFQFPHNIVVDKNDVAYVTDGYARAIWKIPAGGQPEKWVSGEPFVNPVGLTIRSEMLWVVDPRAKGVFQVDPQGKVTRVELKP